MPRLIDGRELHRQLKDLSERYRASKQFGMARGLSNAMELVVDSPTIDPIRAADGCRCGECKHFDPNSEDKCTALIGLVEPDEDDFCSYGEPMEAQDDG